MAAKKITVECGESLAINSVADLYGKLSKALETSSTIELDTSGVEKVDTAGLQLLVALEHEVEKSSGKVSYKNPSEALQQAVVTMGLNSHLTI